MKDSTNTQIHTVVQRYSGNSQPTSGMILTRREREGRDRPPIIHNYNNLAGNISQLPTQFRLKAPSFMDRMFQAKLLMNSCQGWHRQLSLYLIKCFGQLMSLWEKILYGKLEMGVWRIQLFPWTRTGARPNNFIIQGLRSVLA